MDSRSQRATGTVVDPRMSLAMWLRTGRVQRKLSLEDVAKITKIQPRILEKLESGQLDGLPAEVFVKGFVRSFAKCVGLPESEAIERYGAAQSGQATAIAKALVETMSPTVRLVQPKVLTIEAEPELEPAIVAEPVAETVAAPAIEVVEVVTLAEIAPVAVVERAPAAAVEAAPVETPAAVDAPTGSPVVEIAAALTASLEPAPAPKKKRAPRKKKTTVTPVVAGDASDSAAAIVAEAVIAAATGVETAPTPAPKRSRKKKTTVSPVVAAAVVEAVMAEAQVATSETTTEVQVADAPSTLSDITVSAIDAAAEPLPETTPFVRIDAMPEGDVATAVDVTDLAELHEAASFAMSLTSEYELELTIEETDGDVAELQLAEGSQRISSSAIEVEDHTSGTWQPTMPALASMPSAPWRRPQLPTQNAYVVPSLVIDDADPDSADREREVRAAKDHSRLSFLPPILLDREDRSARQGGLTLAVIILLIAATLTLSYLMRRPSPSGDGVTLLDGQTQLYS